MLLALYVKKYTKAKYKAFVVTICSIATAVVVEINLYETKDTAKIYGIAGVRFAILSTNFLLILNCS